jgi:hypothetical protein
MSTNICYCLKIAVVGQGVARLGGNLRGNARGWENRVEQIKNQIFKFRETARRQPNP